MIELTFLGTSSGVPTRFRNVSALAVRFGQGSSWMLVDCGEGTQHQVQRVKHSLKHLTAIFITHAHGDHCYGLPGLLASAGMNARTEPLTLVAPRPVLNWIRATCEYSDLHLPYELRYVVVENEHSVWAEGAARVQRHTLEHRVPSFAYSFDVSHTLSKLDTEKLKTLGLPAGPLWKRLQTGEDVALGEQTIRSADVLTNTRTDLRIVVGGDNARASCLEQACANADVLVHEATYTQEHLAKVGSGPMHSCAADVAAFAQNSGLRHLVLTHVSPRYDSAEHGIELLRQEAAANFHGGLYLAQDFAVYRLGLDREFLRIDEAENSS